MDKILFVMDQGIGNMLMAIPALKAIKIAQPQAKLTVFCTQVAATLIEPLPFIDKTIQECDEDERFDIALLSIWHQGFKATYNDEWIGNHTLQSVEARIVNPDAHETEYHMALAEKVGYVGEWPAPEITVESFDVYERLDMPEGSDFVVLADTCVAEDWARKRWPYFPDLAHKLIKEGKTVVLIGGPKEDKEIDLSIYPDEVVPVFDLSLPQIAHLLSHADYFIGNDSGPSHMAGLFTHTFVLFGPTRITKNKPYGDRVEILCTKIPCSPCQYQGWWDTCTETQCMNNLTVDYVHTYTTASHKLETMPDALLKGLPEREKLSLASMPEQEERLVVYMRVKDAAATLGECLKRVSEVADKIFIVDNGSTDSTFHIYHRYSAFSSLVPVDGKIMLFDEIPPELEGIVDHISDGILCTVGLDEPRDRRVMNWGIRHSGCTWAMMVDADEILEDKLNRDTILKMMKQWDFSGIAFRHVHFWNDKNHYRIDHRWKPKHNRMMFRIMPEAHILSNQRTNPGIVQNLKGPVLQTDYVVKHYGHIDKAENVRRQAVWRSIDNEAHKDWTGMSYDHMTDETELKLAIWEEDAKEREWGVNSTLMVLLHGGGDVLMATPTIARLKELNPTMELSVMGLGVTNERDFRTGEIFENNPHIHRYYPSSLDHHPSWWSEAHFNAEDLPVIQSDINKISQLTRFDTIIYITLQDNRHMHRIDRIANSANAQLTDRSLEIYPSTDERRWAAQFLGENIHARHGLKIASIHRFCGHPPKSWGYDSCFETCVALGELGWNIILWDQDQRELMEEDRSVDLPHVLNMRPFGDDLTVLRTAALLELCDIHIGADSMPMHLASAVGIPVIGLFETTFPSETAPLNDNAVVIASNNALNISALPFILEESKRIYRAGDESISADVILPVVNELMGEEAEYPKTIRVTIRGLDLEVFVSEKHQYKRPLLTTDMFILRGDDITPLESDTIGYGDYSEQQVSYYLPQYFCMEEMTTFLDIGAGVGYYSKLAKWHGLGVVAFESDLESAEVFSRNVPDAKLYPLPLDQEKKIVYLNARPFAPEKSFVSSERWYLSESIDATILDTLNLNADIIKIDVGSSTIPVLKGATETLKRAKVIFGEELPSHRQKEFAEISQLLTDAGFILRGIGHNHFIGVKPPLELPSFALNTAYRYDEFPIVHSSISSLWTKMDKLVSEHPELVHNPMKWFETAMFRRVEASMPLPPHEDGRVFRRILDVGSGLSVLPIALAMGGCHVGVVEPDEVQLRIMKSALEGNEVLDRMAFYEGSIFDLPHSSFTNKFDAVTLWSVIEHVENDTEMLLEAIKFIRPSGFLFVSTDYYKEYIEYPDANRTIVTDRDEHTDSRIYDKDSLWERIVNPLIDAGMELYGEVDFDNVDMNDDYFLPVRGFYGFARLVFQKPKEIED